MRKSNPSDPCPCGSSKQFQHCCLPKDAAELISGTGQSNSQAIANAETLYDLGNKLHLEGKLDEAIASYLKAIAINPSYVEAHDNLGMVFQKQGKLNEAVACFRNALAIKPNYVIALNNLGQTLRFQGKLAEAIISYRNALLIKPGYADAHYNLGNTLKDQGKLDAAIASYCRAISCKPDFAEAYNYLAYALRSQGKLDEAVEIYCKAIIFRPDYAEVHYNLGNIFQIQGKLDTAVESYRKAISCKPHFAEAHNNMGIALQGLGRLDEAIENFRRAAAYKADFAEAYNNMGNSLKNQGKLAAEAENFCAPLSLKPGCADQTQDDMSNAIACYRKAISIKPNIAETHSNLGYALLLTSQFSEGWKEYWWRINPQERLNYSVQPFPGNPLFTRRADELLPSSLQGVRITLLKDQGLGDELFFLRFAKELQKRGAWVAYVADPRIALFVRRAKWVDYVTENEEVIGDSHVALLAGDLPLVLGMTTEADIPPPVPLEVLPEKRQEITLRLAHLRMAMQPKIGITWRGGADKQPGKKSLSKEIPPEQLAAALQEIQATFVIVQRNPQPGEIAAFEAALGQSVLDLSDLNDDLEGMLALMAQLDDYVGVSNTNMHLRASVGKTARVLVPHLRDFRWMAKGGSSPWFPGFTVYRRAPDNSWDSALEQLKSHIL